MVLPYQVVLNNKFLVGRILGNPGGFGVTYLAWDLVLHTTVAIKEYFPRNLASRSPDHSTVILNNDKSKGQDNEQFSYGLKQFMSEARTLAQFSHPNIVRVREYFEQNNTAYLVMDYYEGVSLEEFVQRKGGRISEHLAFSVMLPILDGLRAVHQKNVLHRDIKPANIYLTKGDVPILLDFGAARFAIGQKSQALSVILTAGFAPFEQYLEEPGDLLGAWTDIYACGATLYAITTGIMPQNAINRHQKDELISPIQIVPTLTPQLSRAIMAALTLDPEQRPQTVQAFQTLLLSSDPIYNNASSFAPQKIAIQNQDSSSIVPPANKPPFTVQDESVPAFQNTQPAPESSQKTAAEIKPGNFIRCPHCKARNNITAGQVYSKLHCQHCGKKISSRPTQDSPSIIGWKQLLFLLIVGLVIAKQQTQPPPPPAPAEINKVAETKNTQKTISPVETPPAKSEQPVQPANIEQLLPPPALNNERIPVPVFSDNEPPAPPQMAQAACEGKQKGESCMDNRGWCDSVAGGKYFACIPKGLRPPSH
jgi:serine/threonine protein kinase